MWEYAEHGMMTTGLHTDLRDMGRDGWELVSHHIVGDNHFMIFKRPLRVEPLTKKDTPADYPIVSALTNRQRQEVLDTIQAYFKVAAQVETYVI